jgi:magnesium transporter
MSELGPAAAACLVGEHNHFRWFHVEDVKGPALDELAVAFGLHDLAIEDCRNLRQRSKVDDYDTHIFLVLNTLHFDKTKRDCWFGEFNVFAGKDFLITVHDGPSRTYRAVLPKFQAEPKMAHPGHLLRALLDYIVDQYLPVLDTVEERIEEMEEEVIEKTSPAQLSEIFALRRALINFRRVATGMRDAVNHLLYRTEPWLRTEQLYLRNVYDHIVRALDFVETYREILTGVLDVHLTATANRTNEIMKVLTIYTTIAAPILLITGYFGQNFDSLPLLHQSYGVPVMHGLLLISSLGALWFFKRRGWY